MTQDCGMMSQHSTMAPGDRRQELQWSREIMGMCEVISFGVWISLDGMGGIMGRSERGGTLTVYRTAEQKQPPFKVKASLDRFGILDLVLLVGTELNFEVRLGWAGLEGL